MLIKLLYATIFFSLCSLLTHPIFALKKHYLDAIKIKNITYEGTGCPKNSVYSDISPDKEIFTLLFNQFIVEKNGAITPFKQSKNCKITITLEKPSNIGFKFFSLALEGATDLESNVLAKQEILVKTKISQEKKPKREITIKGPYADEYERVEEFNLKDLRWASCGKKESKIILKTKISVSPFPKKKNNKSGYMSLDMTEGFVKQKTGLVWEKCKKGKKEKPFISFCKVKIENTKKDLVVRERMIKARGQTEQKSMRKAKRKTKSFCEELSKRRPKLTCSYKKTLCKTQELD